MNGEICNRSTREVSDKQKLLKPKGVDRKKINPSGVNGEVLRCLSCGSFRHLLDDCPDSWENMERKKSAEAEHVNKWTQSVKEKEGCEASTVFGQIASKSGQIEE